MSALTQLKYLNINNCSTLKNISGISTLTGINSLDIRYNGITPASAAPVLQVMTSSADTLRYSTGQLDSTQIATLTTKGVILPKY
jgi:hypothetical protein